jgi:hypothetical protein
MKKWLPLAFLMLAMVSFNASEAREYHSTTRVYRMGPTTRTYTNVYSGGRMRVYSTRSYRHGNTIRTQVKISGPRR